jgi:hypothetical protein
MTTKKNEPAQTDSPAGIARREHEAVLASIDKDITDLRDRITMTTAVLKAAKAPSERQAALDERLAISIAARYSGETAAESETDLAAEIDRNAAEIAAQAPTVRGAALALEKINAQLVNLHAKRAAELERRQAVQFAEASERLDALALKGEQIAAQLDDFNAAMIAASIARDHLRPLNLAPCAHQFKVAYRLPVPFGLNTFDELGRHRDIGPDVQRRAAEILAELGADAGNIR